jgi:hypothetical protein
MSTRQTATTLLEPGIHKRLTEYCQKQGITVSRQLEIWVRDKLNEKGPQTEDPLRKMMTGAMDALLKCDRATPS